MAFVIGQPVAMRCYVTQPGNTTDAKYKMIAHKIGITQGARSDVIECYWMDAQGHTQTNQFFPEELASVVPGP
jgi:uncharacterized protein YodC (DUF2158 family)